MLLRRAEEVLYALKAFASCDSPIACWNPDQLWHEYFDTAAEPAAGPAVGDVARLLITIAAPLATSQGRFVLLRGLVERVGIKHTEPAQTRESVPVRDWVWEVVDSATVCHDMYAMPIGQMTDTHRPKRLYPNNGGAR
jgi:hypothetical protein